MKQRRLAALSTAALVASSCGLVGGDDGATDAVWELDGEPTASAVGYLTYEPSPNGEWVAFRSDGSICLAPLTSAEADGVAPDSEGTQCFETPATNLAWSPDSERVAVNFDAVRFIRPGPVELLGIDGTRTTLIDGEPLVFDTAWLDADTLVYAEIIRSDDSLASVIWYRASADGGEPLVYFEPDPAGPSFPLSYWSLGSDGDLGVGLIGDDDATALVIHDEAETSLLQVPTISRSRFFVDARSTGDGVVVLRDTATIDRRPLEDGTGWWIASRDVDQPLQLRAPDPAQTRIVDAVLSPNGTTLAVITEPWERGGQLQYSLSLMPLIDVIDAEGVLDLGAATSINAEDGTGVGLTNPIGQLRWTLDDQLLVIGNRQLLVYSLSAT